MSSFSIMVTGHRQLVPEGYTGNPWPNNSEIVANHHERIMQELAKFLGSASTQCKDMGYKVVDVISGMALGADQLFLKAGYHVKNWHTGTLTRLIAAVPFKGQESKWTVDSQVEYNIMLQYCDEIVCVCEPGYAPWKMQKRNEWMVNKANLVIAVWDGTEKGGIYNCIQYAKKVGRTICVLNPRTLEWYTL